MQFGAPATYASTVVNASIGAKSTGRTSTTFAADSMTPTPKITESFAMIQSVAGTAWIAASLSKLLSAAQRVRLKPPLRLHSDGSLCVYALERRPRPQQFVHSAVKAICSRQFALYHGGIFKICEIETAQCWWENRG